MSDGQQLAVGGDLLTLPLGPQSCAGASAFAGGRCVCGWGIAARPFRRIRASGRSDVSERGRHPTVEWRRWANGDISFHDGAIDAQRVAILQLGLDSGGNDQIVDCFNEYWRQPVVSTVEGVVLWHGLAVEPGELPQRVAVGDPVRPIRGSPNFSRAAGSRTGSFARR